MTAAPTAPGTRVGEYEILRCWAQWIRHHVPFETTQQRKLESGRWQVAHFRRLGTLAPNPRVRQYIPHFGQTVERDSRFSHASLHRLVTAA